MAVARRGAARRVALALVAALSAGQTLAFAQTQPQAQQDRPTRRTPQAPPPANTTGDADGAAAAPSARPLARKPGAALKPRPALPVLSSAVRSRYGAPKAISRSTAGQCRAQCAEARGQCFNADSVDTSGCDPGWTQCLSTCEGLTYSRGP